MPQLAPESKRLLPEVFRRVAVPYSGAFSASSRSALSEIVTTALAGAPASPKHAVATRLNRMDGMQERGRRLDSHLDEFAVAFGFLEDAGTTYIPGKFALAMHFVGHAHGTAPFVNKGRAERAVWLYALLERHGDCLMPFLALAAAGQANTETFIARIQESIRFKLDRLLKSPLPRNASFHEAIYMLNRMAVAWGSEESPRGARRRSSGTALDVKTLGGYLSRTAAYAQGTGLTNKDGSNSDAGAKLLSHWTSETSAAPVVEIPPSGEAIHDAFALDPARYASVFRPPVSAGVIESLVYSIVLPDRHPERWQREELGAVLTQAVEALGEPLSNSARIDSVRLALFAHAVAVGRPVQLDNDVPFSSDVEEPDYNANAVVQLGLSNPKLFHLGHARTGRRFWSITLLRR